MAPESVNQESLNYVVIDPMTQFYHVNGQILAFPPQSLQDGHPPFNQGFIPMFLQKDNRGSSFNLPGSQPHPLPSTNADNCQPFHPKVYYEVSSYMQHVLQSHKLSMAQTFQEMEIMKKYFDIQQRRMRASHLEFEHLHHMLQYWENTLFHSSSSAVSATDPSYYDQPENRQHESNTVINNAELMMGVIPNFGLANIPSAATEISIADSNEADTASSSIGGSERNDRGKNTVRNSPPYAPFTGVRCFGISGGSGGSGLLPTSR